jgi:hypothetical protein
MGVGQNKFIAIRGLSKVIHHPYPFWHSYQFSSLG